MQLTSSTVSAFWGELEKIAAPRHIKILRKMVSSGRMAEAQEFAAELVRKGVMKVTDEGTNIGRMKPGAEAVTDIIAGSRRHGPVAVRGVYDPKGPIFSKEQLGAKQQVYRAVAQRTAPRASGHLPIPSTAGGAEDFVPATFHKGRRGARYYTSPLIENHEGINLNRSGQYAYKRLIRSETRKKEHIKRVTGRDVSPMDVRAKKREPIIQELVRRGVNKREAEHRALQMIPQKGGARIDDLHSGNVRGVDGRLQILDFNALPAHRIGDVRTHSYDAADTSLGRMKQLQADHWESLTGVRPSVEDIGQAPNAYGYVFPSGLNPRSTPEAIRRTLHGLGKGSRQAKKVRGAKAEAEGRYAALLRSRQAQAVAQQAPQQQQVIAPRANYIPALAAAGLGTAGLGAAGLGAAGLGAAGLGTAALGAGGLGAYYAAPR
jgi:hypothetical protein